VPERDPTYIGAVRHVLGATITVALDPQLAGVAPIYRGKLQSVGQIGSLVRIPQGLVDLIASVSLLGIAELSGPLAPAEALGWWCFGLPIPPFVWLLRAWLLATSQMRRRSAAS